MTKKYILILLALSLITHFAFFDYPAETVFDEVHFGKFASGYLTGEYFFDIHPPLGKLIIAGMAKISGFKPGFSFENIGQKFSDDSFKWLRFLPKLAGTFVPIVIFLIALELGISQKYAFLAGLLLVFENSLLVQSRLILIDSFLLLFGFLGILFYLKHTKYKIQDIKYLFLSGFFAVLAASVKWTGLSFLGIIGLFYLFNLFKSEQKIKLALKGAVFLVIIPFLIYLSIFAIHFFLLDKPGPGLAFHPPNFQEMNLFEKFVELNSEIYQSNARLTSPHPYSSPWYSWPLMTRPIYYWTHSTNSGQAGSTSSPQANARIYLLGNPLIWWLTTIAVIYFTINFFKNRKNLNYSLMATGYWLNLLPFIFIGRVMFLYHYFTSLIFAILILCFQLDQRGGPTGGPPLHGMTMSTAGVRRDRTPLVFYLVLTGSIILFLFFSPLTYGLPVPEWYYKMTVWLPSWR